VLHTKPDFWTKLDTLITIISFLSLVNLSSVFSAEHLSRELMSTHVVGKSVFCYDSVESTNTLAHVFAKNGASSGTVITADFQSKGRGRHQHTWQGAKGENIMVSVILRPETVMERLTLLPMAVAVAVAETIEDCTPLFPEIKWPNDVLIDHKKISGILLESSYSANRLEYVIVGIGLNVNQTTFSSELESRATSLQLECKRTFEFAPLFIRLMKSLDENYFYFVEEQDIAIREAWKQRTLMLGKPITFTRNGKTEHGVALDIDLRGLLQVQSDNKTMFLSQAEITHIRYEQEV
jgi:BirA family transcriptional regulator, biotin operon repressor / biotin---[acetyl-CoA-carboxylase] ligase